MGFWEDGFVRDLLWIIALLAVAAGLRRSLEPLRRLAVPDALVAGAMAAIMGPSLLGWLDFDSTRFESLVYHGLALIFVAVSLQSPPKGKRSKSARSIAFAIPFMAVFQGILGLTIVLVWNAMQSDGVHPGVGLMLPLGFNQGPGAALSLGTAWEKDTGMVSGGQIGLIMAAAGFLWCSVFGVALVGVGRARGWHKTRGYAETEPSKGDAASDDADPAPTATPPGVGLEPLTAQFVAIGISYLMAFGLLSVLTPFVPEKAAQTMWAFHFIIASGMAILVRMACDRLPGGSPLDDALLARTSALVVDLTTACALAAVSFAVLGAFWLPVLVFATAGGVTTLVVVTWLGRRAFGEAPFEHVVICFGAMTGTATTGMALLRMLDPELRGPVARNFVMAATGSSLLALPLFALMNRPVTGFPETYPTAVTSTVGILVAYAIILFLAWWRFGALRGVGRVFSLWPRDEAGE